jgi:hypothetical protein
MDKKNLENGCTEETKLPRIIRVHGGNQKMNCNKQLNAVHVKLLPCMYGGI